MGLAAQILLVDDEDMVRMQIRSSLELEGHQVREASNGREAIDMLNGYKPDLMITDILMPEKEGIETIMEVRQKYADIKIIAISGGVRTENMDFLKIAKRLGADLALPKPFGRQQLLTLVNQLLGTKATS
jgi:CheY-like chemotaxis protein